MTKKEMNYLKYHSQTFDNIVERLSDYLEFRKFLKIEETNINNDSLFLQLREELDNLNYNYFNSSNELLGLFGICILSSYLLIISLVDIDTLTIPNSFLFSG